MMFRHMRQGIFSILILLTFLGNARATPPPARAQIRALWVDGFHAGFRTAQEADQLVADAQAAHLNLLLVQVRRRGDSFYTHSVEVPVEDDPYRPDFDALGYLIEKAHAAGIAVHAWVNVTPIWRGGPDPAANAPKDPRHIFNIHGLQAVGEENWLTQTYDGQRKFSVGYFLDPGHPAAAGHIVRTILNIVKNYPVDGIHLDYIRYPETSSATEASGSPAGYNALSVERFHRRYGGTGLPAANDPKWSAWRREQVTNLVRRIYLGIQETNSKVQLSAALVPWGDGPPRRAEWPHAHPYWRVFQDWAGWLDSGYIDMATPMNYSREDSARTRGFFQHWIEFEKNNKRDRLLAVGLGAYMNPAADSEKQIKRVSARSRLKKPADGWVIYSYFASAREGKSLLQALSEDAAPTPPLPARPASREGTLVGMIPASDGDIVEIARKTGRTWAKPVKVRTDGNGFFGATRLAPGVYRVKSGERMAEVKVEAGAVSRAF